MKSKRFNFWIQEEKLKEIKQRAKEQNKSVSAYIKDKLRKAEQTPNLSLGNWWDDSDKLKKIIKAVKEDIK